MEQKKKKKKVFFVLTTVVFSTILVMYLVQLSNPYAYILSDTENQFKKITLYKKILPESKFNILVNKLLQSNDIRTINTVAYFCNENVLCNQIQALEQKTNELYQIPADSTWIITINNSHTRKSSRNMLDLPNNINYNLKLLKTKCKNTYSN